MFLWSVFGCLFPLSVNKDLFLRWQLLIFACDSSSPSNLHQVLGLRAPFPKTPSFLTPDQLAEPLCAEIGRSTLTISVLWDSLWWPDCHSAPMATDKSQRKACYTTGILMVPATFPSLYIPPQDLHPGPLANRDSSFLCPCMYALEEDK